MFRTKQVTLRVLLTLAVAFLPIFSGISSGLHLMFVRHVVCSTHGELIHANEVCELPAHDLESRAEPSSATLGVRDGAELPADEHCQVVVLSRASFVKWQTRGALFELPRNEQVRATERREAPALSIEPIALAPKQSPPA